MESLKPSEIERIKAFVNKYHTGVIVVGSRAAGTATDLSDFDYIIAGNAKIRHAARRELPRGRAGGEIAGYGETGIDVSNANTNPLDPRRPHIIFNPTD